MHVTYISFEILSKISLDVTKSLVYQTPFCCAKPMETKTYGNKAKSGILISFRDDAIFVLFVIFSYFLCGDRAARRACKKFMR